jgi:hypothetical protein
MMAAASGLLWGAKVSASQRPLQGKDQIGGRIAVKVTRTFASAILMGRPFEELSL